MGSNVVSVYTLSWLFTACLTLVWTSVQGKYQLIGSDEPIVAVLGEDVTLPCYVDPELDVQDWTVEWSIPGRRSDPLERQSRKDVVFLYRVRMELRDMMIVSYIGRTSLFVDRLQHGDMSLKIRNVTLEDEARYRCFSPAVRREVFVQLVVDPNLNASTTETSLLPTDLPAPDPEEKKMSSGGRSRLALWICLGVFIVLLVVAVFILLWQHKKRNNEATQCKQFLASLPCSTAGMC